MPALRWLVFAGVAAIVRSVGAQNWALDRTPTVRIPAATAEGVQFATAVSATRLPNGAVAIVDRGANTVAVFDAQGKRLRTISRAGSGPGEFRAPGWIGSCGTDSVFVLDLPLRSILVFSIDGALGRQVALGGAQQGAACSGAGRFAFLSTPRPMPKPGEAQGSPIAGSQVAISVSDATFAELKPVGEYASGDVLRMGGGGIPRPLSAQTQLAMSPTQLFVGVSGQAQIEVFSVDGTRARAFPVPSAESAPTKAQYEAALERTLQQVPPAFRDRARGPALAAPLPDKLPAYSALLADASGMVWTVVSAPGDESTRLRAYRGDGSRATELMLRGDIAIFEIGRDYVLGVATLADGDQEVRVHRLTRGR
jgi:hypothetical protein